VWLGGTYGLIRDLMGVEGASFAFYDDPSLIADMVSHLTYFYSTLLDRVLATGLELDWAMFWEDLAYNHGSLVSPAMFAQYCMPFYFTIIDVLKRHGVKVIMLDSDGNIEGMIPLWLDAGINVMHPMEVAAGMDVRAVRRQYGTRVSFLGGISKKALAAGREAIDAEVIPKLRELQDTGGGLVAQCDHGVPPDVSLDNYRYFRDLVRELSE
jgi:uroporphyrinogen decarboxylase